MDWGLEQRADSAAEGDNSAVGERMQTAPEDQGKERGGQTAEEIPAEERSRAGEGILAGRVGGIPAGSVQICPAA